MIQHGLLCRCLRPIDARYADGVRTKNRSRGGIVEANPLVRHDPPPGFPDLKANRRSGISGNRRKGARYCLQIAHCIAIGR